MCLRYKKKKRKKKKEKSEKKSFFFFESENKVLLFFMEKFLAINGFSKIIRSHEQRPRGYLVEQNEKLVPSIHLFFI
jgi:hypothetical protein